MKILKHLTSIFLPALVAWSCTEQLTPEEKPADGTPISIECGMQAYSKATDTSFEEGDDIGLYVYTSEIYMDNERFTNKSGKFVPETPRMWYEGNAESEFIAYYPYQDKSWGKGRTLQFCVNADQRTHENYTASDLMLARKRTAPTAEPVVLVFEHVLSKALVTIENKLQEDIAEVMFSGVKGSLKYHIDSSRVELDGKAGIVKAARSNADKRQWAMVLPPQEAAPELVIITAGQKEYRYKLDKTFRLESGKCHSASITVDAESASTEISSEIKDWLPGNDFNFGQDAPQKEWVSIGTGTFIDDAVSPLLGLPVAILEVDVEESVRQKGLYRVVDPYKKAPFYARYASDTPGELVIEIEDTTTCRAHLHDSDLGLKMENEEVVLCENPDAYGVMIPQNKNICFNKDCLTLKVGQNTTYLANQNRFFMLVLPGGELPAMDQFDINGMYSYTDNNGVDQIKVELFVYMKYSKDIFYRFYDASVDIQQEWRKYLNGELQMTQLAQPKNGMRNDILYTPGKSGVYTVLVAGKNAAGKDFAQTDRYTYKKEGEVIPPPAVNLSVKQNPNYPEGEMFLNIKVQDQILNYDVRYAPVNDTSKVQTPKLYLAPAGSHQTPEGAVVNITNLEPATEYVMTVSVKALDEKVYRYETRCRTAPESSYTLLGEGKFIDNTSFTAWQNAQGQTISNYETPVQIYQDNGNPDKFRMMAPYRNYWANQDPGFVQNQLPLHNGLESAYVDFYRYTGPDGRVHIAFSEIDTGLTVSGYPGSSYYFNSIGEIRYNVNHHCFVNSTETEGVFNLNPVSAYVRNTPFYHGVLNFENTLQILLPRADGNLHPADPGQGIAFDYFEVPQTLKSKPEYKYILHSGETYTSHQKVRNYSACYDTRRHNPIWVAYPCHDIWWEGGYGRPVKDPWRPDPQMKESEQSIIYANDWNNWPWTSNNGRPTDNKQYWTPSAASFYFTKGHLMRSSERGTMDKHTLFKMNEQTFYPTNISPERYPTVKRASDNRNITHWSIVEGIMPNEWRCSDTLYVVAGCYYENDSFTAVDATDNGSRSPDSKVCVVPTARWKVFLRTKSGVTGKPVSQCRADELMAIAFWFPQALGASNVVSELPPLAEYTLSVDDLEARIGGEFNFFPQVPAEVCRTFNASDWPGLDAVINVKLDSSYNGPYI